MAPKYPSVIVPGPRKSVTWGDRTLLAEEADEGFYRVCGVKGSGKTHLMKNFVLEALREVESNPYAKLVVYEPKREFYAWLASLGLSRPVHYFMPSDKRSVPLDFMADYPNDLDSLRLAYAFHPLKRNETQPFWGDALRTIYAGVMTAIKHRAKTFDLRLTCSVLESEEFTEKLLGYDPYLVQAKKLIKDHGDAVGETKQNIQMTIHSRIAQMKLMAAHLDQARGEPFSLRRFVEDPGMGSLVISKDSTYGVVQDPLNAVLISRLVEILDSEQYDKRRKIFLVIDEFPTLAGDDPCPGVYDMFLRLRSRGVVVAIAYQAYSTLKRVYGEHASEILGQCTNIMYLRQPDVDSAKYGADDLGWEKGYERTPSSTSFNTDGSASFSSSQQYYDRPIFSHTDLMGIPPARAHSGLHGVVKTAEREDPDTLKLKPVKNYPENGEQRPTRFSYPPEFVDKMPKRRVEVPEYEKLDPQYTADAVQDGYFERIRETQRVRSLTPPEKVVLGIQRTPPPPE